MLNPIVQQLKKELLIPGTGHFIYCREVSNWGIAPLLQGSPIYF